jgi:hypothetical protein
MRRSAHWMHGQISCNVFGNDRPIIAHFMISWDAFSDACSSLAAVAYTQEPPCWPCVVTAWVGSWLVRRYRLAIVTVLPQ